MSKRVLILFCSGLAAIVAAFLFLKYELSQPESDQESGQEQEREPEKEPYDGITDNEIVETDASDKVVLEEKPESEIKTKKTAKNA